VALLVLFFLADAWEDRKGNVSLTGRTEFAPNRRAYGCVVDKDLHISSISFLFFSESMDGKIAVDRDCGRIRINSHHARYLASGYHPHRFRRASTDILGMEGQADTVGGHRRDQYR